MSTASEQFEQGVRIARSVMDHREWAKKHAGTELGKYHARSARVWEKHLREGADAIIRANAEALGIAQ